PDQQSRREPGQLRASPVAVVDEERDQQRDPRQDQVPGEEPEVCRPEMHFADELERAAERGGQHEPREDEETLVRVSARAQTHESQSTQPRGTSRPRGPLLVLLVLRAAAGRVAALAVAALRVAALGVGSLVLVAVAAAALALVPAARLILALDLVVAL